MTCKPLGREGWGANKLVYTHILPSYGQRKISPLQKLLRKVAVKQHYMHAMHARRPIRTTMRPPTEKLCAHQEFLLSELTFFWQRRPHSPDLRNLRTMANTLPSIHLWICKTTPYHRNDATEIISIGLSYLWIRRETFQATRSTSWQIDMAEIT